jgi:tungstate transport system permease protein
MDEQRSAFHAAFLLLANADRELAAIVALSLQVSLTAAVVGFALGLPLGAALAMLRFPGRGTAIVLANTLLGLPPVVAGLVVYLALSRSGPLGALGILFTPAAMVIAQVLLTLPIAAALSHRALAPRWAELRDPLLVDGANLTNRGRILAGAAAPALVTAFLACFGRAIAEVGAILVVGGNIRNHTRTMTTAVALETQKGDLPLALGLVLISVALAVNAIGLAIAPRTA